jgi:hypothetical protein
VLRRVEHDPALVHEDHPRRELERPGGAVLREHDGRARPLHRREEQRRRLGIELGRRLVEQEERRLERERRGKTDALQLAAGELDRLPAPEVKRVDRGERALDARPDLGRGHTEILEPEDDLVRDDGHHDLVLRVLEDGRDRPGELGGTRAAGVQPRHDDAARETATVKVRYEPRECTEERRFPRARRPEQGDDLAGLERQRELAQGRLARWVGEREALDGG